MRLPVHGNVHARLKTKHVRVAHQRFVRFDANVTLRTLDPQDVFGDEYRAYKQRVPAVIPRV